MSQAGMATEQLISIIHSIKVGQKSGVLTARRGDSGMMEEGRIVFANGLMTQATTGRRSGLAAFNLLCTWGRCYYTFLPSPPEANQPVTPAFPAEQFPPTTGPLSEAQRPRVSGPQPAPGPDMERSLPVTPPPDVSTEYNHAGASAGPVEKRIIPYAILPLQEVLHLIDQHRLSRSHRQLFLLIDGRRSLVELMHLTRKSAEEIQTLLRDLERLGAIYRGGN